MKIYGQSITFWIALIAIRSISPSLACQPGDNEWDALAESYSCGSRISWLQSVAGGSKT
jgi:hypothetical protein